MSEDVTPEAEPLATYSPPLVVDVDSGGDREFAVNPAIAPSKG